MGGKAQPGSYTVMLLQCWVVRVFVHSEQQARIVDSKLCVAKAVWLLPHMHISCLEQSSCTFKAEGGA